MVGAQGFPRTVLGVLLLLPFSPSLQIPRSVERLAVRGGRTISDLRHAFR
ncbi:MAG: hypothetical protein V3S25_10915 [Nitrospirales bacterium]